MVSVSVGRNERNLRQPDARGEVGKHVAFFLLRPVVCGSTAIPLQLIALCLVTGSLKPIVAIPAGFMILLHIFCIPIWQRRLRQHLCNTAWAREQGINPATLKLFRWRRSEAVD